MTTLTTLISISVINQEMAGLISVSYIKDAVPQSFFPLFCNYQILLYHRDFRCGGAPF
jgi:hypothetical protein